MSEQNHKILHNVRSEKGSIVCKLYEKKKILGDGHCLFTVLGDYVGMTAIELRKYLKIHASDEELLQMPYLEIFDGSRDGWGGTDVVTCFSRLFEVNVCVHLDYNYTNTITRAYSFSNYKKTIHLYWIVRGYEDYVGHIDIIKGPDDDWYKLIQFEKFIENEGLSRRLLQLKPKSFDFFSKIYDYIHSNNLRKYCITKDLLKLNYYINRSAYKLNEIIREFDIHVPDKVLDMCGAPGGFIQVLLERDASEITSVSLGDYDRSVCSSKNVKLLNININELECDEKFELIVADGAIGNSYKDNSIFEVEVKKSMEHLMIAGNLIIKHNNYFEADISTSSGFFKEIHYYKPRSSREGNTEVYLICLHFSSCMSKIINNERQKFINGINRYIEEKEDII